MLFSAWDAYSLAGFRVARYAHAPVSMPVVDSAGSLARPPDPPPALRPALSAAAPQVDFLASRALSPAELAAQRSRLQAITAATRIVEFDLDGERVSVRASCRGRRWGRRAGGRAAWACCLRPSEHVAQCRAAAQPLQLCASANTGVRPWEGRLLARPLDKLCPCPAPAPECPRQGHRRGPAGWRRAR